MPNGGTLSATGVSLSSTNGVELASTGPGFVVIPVCNEIDCGGNCYGDEVLDDCGVCGGDGSSCAFALSLGAFNPSGTLEILYDFGGSIAGFQFDVTGLALSGASGGAAGDAGFDVTAGGTTVIGFSIAGDTIASGSGVLTTLSFSDIISPTTELSLGNFGAITDSDLNSYDVLSGLIEHEMDCSGTMQVI